MSRRPQQPKRMRVNRLSPTAMTALFTDRPQGGRSVKHLSLFILLTTEREPWTERAGIVQGWKRRDVSTVLGDCCVVIVYTS